MSGPRAETTNTKRSASARRSVVGSSAATSSRSAAPSGVDLLASRVPLRPRRPRANRLRRRRPQTVPGGGRDLHRRHLRDTQGMIAAVSSSPEPRPVRPVSAIDVRGVGEALDDGDRDTTWWYDPSTGEVEPGVSEWIAADLDEDDESRRAWPRPDRVARFTRGVRRHGGVRRGGRRPARRRPAATSTAGPRRVPPVPRHAARLPGPPHALVDVRPRPCRGAGDRVAHRRALRRRSRCRRRAGDASGHARRGVGRRRPTTRPTRRRRPIADRWREIEQTLDAGHDVTLLRDGRPWATISPA